jgi:protein-S-isoprenylcysteine O-methyltransferase Ste14
LRIKKASDKDHWKMRGMAVIVLLVLSYAVLMFEAEHLPPNWALGAQLLLPLIAFATVAWAFVPDRKRSN